MIRRYSTIAVMAAVVGAVGCSELGDVSRGVCGNGFVEDGEDCDGTSAGASCGAAREAFECRWRCGSAAAGATCPTDFTCGVDGVCRVGSGSFDGETAGALGAAPLWSTIADLDGDHRRDLIETHADRIVVRFFGAELEQSAALSLPIDSEALNSNVPPMMPVACGEVSGDGLDDALIPFQLGFMTQIGGAPREPRLTAHPLVTLPPAIEDAGLVLANVLPTPAGDDIILFATLNGISGLAYVDLSTGNGQATPSLLTALPAPFSQAIKPVLVGQLDATTASPCEELIVAYEEKPDLYAFSPCRIGASGLELNKLGATRPLALPAGRVATSSLAFFDLNLDDKLDVVVGARTASGYELAVGYGVGDGSFHSLPGVPLSAGDDQLSTLLQLDGGPPLAIADLDADGQVDWVDPAGVHVSQGTLQAGYTNLQAPFTSALIGSFNASGGLDVVASDGGDQITFLNGVGDGSFVRFTLPAGGAVRQLAAGDLDGDLLTDLAVSTHVEAGLEALAVAYGSATGAPAELTDVGQLDPVQQITVGRSARDGIVDPIDDLVLVSKAASGEVGLAFLLGASSRRIRAPFVLSRVDPANGVVDAHVPLQSAVAELTQDDHGDIAVLAERFIKFDEHRLYLVRAHDRVQLSTLDSVATLLPEDVAWRRAAVLAVELDGSSPSEIVLLAPSTDGSRGRARIARSLLVDERYSFALDAPIELDFAACAASDLADPCGAAVADLDGDGRADVAALGRRGGADPVLAVLWNDGSGLSSPTLLEGVAPSALAVVQRAGRSELVALVGNAVHRVVVGEARTLSLDAVPALANASGNRLIAGDLDGDGVDDLAIWGSAGVFVHRGVPQSE